MGTGLEPRRPTNRVQSAGQCGPARQKSVHAASAEHDSSQPPKLIGDQFLNRARRSYKTRQRLRQASKINTPLPQALQGHSHPPDVIALTTHHIGAQPVPLTDELDILEARLFTLVAFDRARVLDLPQGPGAHQRVQCALRPAGDLSPPEAGTEPGLGDSENVVECGLICQCPTP